MLTDQQAGGRTTDGADNESPDHFARFWKCALQVNPAGYARAYRGQDHALNGDDFLAALL